MRIVIVGGGVVGLCAGYAIARAGASVTIVERGRCGAGASLGNAGWVTPIMSAPIPRPGAIAQALRWAATPGSPVRVRPRLSLEFIRWCMRFKRACSDEIFKQGAAAMLKLNSRTIDLFDQYQAEGIVFEMHKTGLIFVGLGESSVNEYARDFQWLQRLGYTGSVRRVNHDELLNLEPALGDGVSCGLFAESERHLRPESLTQAGATCSTTPKSSRERRSSNCGGRNVVAGSLEHKLRP